VVRTIDLEPEKRVEVVEREGELWAVIEPVRPSSLPAPAAEVAS